MSTTEYHKGSISPAMTKRTKSPQPCDLIAACDALVARRTTAAIAQYAYYRGHPVVCLEGEACERYANDLSPTVDPDGVGLERPCVSCGLTAAPDGPDPCLGTLPGVVSACCGHGVEEPYVLFRFPRRTNPPVWEGLRGEAARRYFRQQGVGPPSTPALQGEEAL
jgi:hypothetical protein